MISEFYIVNKSFKYQEGVSKEQLEEKIKDLSEDYEYIRQYETERILVHDSIYDEEIYPDITVAEFLGFSPNTKNLFNKQVINYLITIIRKSKRTRIEVDEVIEVLLNEQSPDILHGLICFNEVEGIDKKHLVYNCHNWLDFHRNYLGIFPKNPSFFMNECDKYFPELHFHENNVKTIHNILNDSCKTIIHHLSELNNNLPKCKKNTNNRIDLIKRFNSLSDLDLNASIEGDINKKRVLTFNFSNDDCNIYEPVYCELHLKLLYDDLKAKKQNRIYFHEGKKNIGKGKILVGYIGVHL